LVTPAVTSGRILFLDGLRGVALVFMVVNHTARWWLDLSVGMARYHIIYLTVPLSAPLFLFLVGFCLPLSCLNSAARGASFGRIALKNVRRGALLVPMGWLLTLLVFPDEPLFAGEVLQTIGLSIIGLTPILPILRRRLARALVLVLALGWYATFALALPGLRAWLAGHPVVSEVWFTGFPFWPWFAFPLLGVVLGWEWAERRRTDAGDRAFFTVMLAAGAASLAVFLPLELWLGSAPLHFSSRRDLVLNRHWNPGAVTCLFIVGYIFTVLPLVHYLMELKRWRPGWLVVLGQNALMLYFVHQIIALTLVRQRVGVLFKSWWLYALANVALLALLVGLGRLWPEIKHRARQVAARRRERRVPVARL
jgi:uncharacterized membrane protein